VVAHRLSTVRDADQIAVMSKGAIEDCGTHAELIERCKTYQTLVQRQMSGAPAAAAAAE
jgi:ABC-type multidrug transport system fused ATPase/permease subunit|tara:strand:+ start:381 stop:557 length:177 start_codon:yes stop_codon:yes gene_type:complete